MIQPTQLISIFQTALSEHWGYIYGMSHEQWTEEKQRTYAAKYADDPDRANSVRYGSKWIGHTVTDCSGLFKYAFSRYGSSIAHGSNSIWNNYCSAKGALSGKVLLPGTAVFTSSGNRHNHIGLYVGGGLVIEAQGAQAGVVASKLSNKKWTHWGELKGVNYTERGGGTVSYQARVVGGRLALRDQPQKGSNSPCWIPDGTILTVTDEALEWAKTAYNGHDGWVMKQYLEKVDGGEDTVTVNRKELESIYDQLGDMLGLRG